MRGIDEAREGRLLVGHTGHIPLLSVNSRQAVRITKDLLFHRGLYSSIIVAKSFLKSVWGSVLAAAAQCIPPRGLERFEDDAFNRSVRG